MYNAESDTLTCASCSPNGGQPTGSASLGREGTEVMSRHQAAAVTDPGQVFFDTLTLWSGRMPNGTGDVYEFNAGTGNVSLISEGKQNATSAFAEATSDGKNVFFVTNARLVPQDVDTVNDLYDARVGGGSAAKRVRKARGAIAKTARPVPEPGWGRPASEQLSGTKPVRSTRHKVRKRHQCRRSHSGKGCEAGGRRARNAISPTRPRGAGPMNRRLRFVAPTLLFRLLRLHGCSVGVCPLVAGRLRISEAGTETSILGTPSRQAGAHPDFRVRVRVPGDRSERTKEPDGSVRDIKVTLPAGMVGNPTAIATCAPGQLVGGSGA